MIIHNCQQKSEEWFNLKMGKFSGSGFSKVMSAKTTAGYTNEIYKIVYERLTGERIETYQNEAMRYGVETEPVARLWYETEKNEFVDEVGFIEKSEFIGVSPDGLVGENGLLEIKCPQYNTQIGYLLKDKLPTEYKWQVQGQLWVCEREWCDFLSYHDKLEKLQVRVYRDESLIKELEGRLNEAIEEVQQIIIKLNARTF